MKRPRAVALLEATDLHPGDVLLSGAERTLARADPWVSWLIRWLDASDFSHAGFYDGEQVVTVGLHGIQRGPLYPCDVFRFHHEGTRLGEGDLDPKALLKQADSYLRTPGAYRYHPLYLVGVLVIMRRFARPAWRRMLVESLGGFLLGELRRSIDGHYPTGVLAVTCSELVTRLFCDAARASGAPYDILIELEARHRSRAWRPTSGRFEHLIQQFEEVLSAANPDLPIAVSRARSAAPASFGVTAAAGGPLAPPCFVSPGDLQHSPSFVHVGRLTALPAGGTVRQAESTGLATRDGARAGPAERP